ncbi:hypothetical protein QTI24_18900 [Variovorax sp. J22P240]|uniref:hypothetical protein n=1 Tax=Variovorax sp. J22P240 TaxID=3053514 RepID=UPI002578DDE8|nr:hypothetical protein [Variovorax sp. J22P240]MDM0000691.1 hypothetical protein [Variovorax sp. J22P240]
MWTTTIEAEPMDGGLSYHADIFENGILVCRLALSGRFAGEEAAQIELNRRLNRWIAEYEQRPSSPHVEVEPHASAIAPSGHYNLPPMVATSPSCRRS